ncbi:[F-actin]-monooxygenase MICAL3 [Amphibalanus amphitrite]|uniref:F-actin monooxygenase n=1 Tax=Amphibalanus amphitrite TaxID=1232801 RepID=A0A6A4VCP7_AMPAM|nr:[F-actin]-monooxygenase MICAL3 [Amphibalanus amphitrite]
MHIKSKLKSWKAQGLFAKFDKRASHKCYNQGKACASTKVLVIGCGPCGLRAAIEAQLLGARVVVLEKRDRFSRNNVLHLWPMVIHDLKALGAKKFFGKFCAGAIDHISIRQLQCILLKVALLLGVEVYENVGYEELVEPADERTGWRARLSPPDHPAADFQFDVLVGADGKRNTFKCFRRKEFRGKLAIAITANFVNRRTEAEARVDEISGVAFIFNQKFFRDLYDATGIELENIVYYKDETHYFVMTAKKQSLLAKGVIIQDFMDTNRLLSPENVNRQKLMQYAREAADFSTEHRLPQLPFALNHYGREDVAMFDFTCMYASQNAGKVMERHGHKLLLQLVGDSLLEPFWPTGSGCARGFLSCFDAAWQMRSWANPRVTTLECLAERESIYRQLAQTTPRNLSCEYHGYTLDPRTRYPNLNRASVSPYQVRDLVDTDCPESLQRELTIVSDTERAAERPAKKARKEPLQPDMLLKWCQKQLALTEIQVTDLTLSFKSGLALCGILHKYRPDLVDLSSLDRDDPLANTQLAFSLVESELGVPPVMTAQEMAECACPDRLAMLSYLSQVYDALHGEIPYVKPKIAELLREEVVDPGGGRRPVPGRSQPDGRRSSLSENARKQRKRKSDAAKDKLPRQAADDPFAPPEIGPLDPSKVALVAAAFGDSYQYEPGPDSDSGPETDGERPAAGASDWPGRPQLPVAALEARLAALEAAHAAEPERRQQIRQQRRQLRSLAQRKAELEAALMETGGGGSDGGTGPDDASLHLYRRTAASFEQRRMKLQDMVFHPGRVIQDLKKDLAPGGAGPNKKEEFATKIKDLEAKFKGNYVPPDKKPKDLSRAIGRIEKTDWNVREIERKIEDSKKVHTSREPAQPVPMWSKDMFDDKYQAMRNLAERGAVPPETLRKYADIDQHLRRLEMKLREGTTRDVGQRGSNRVSQMAQQFLDRADRAPPAEKKTEAGAAEACHFCNERVYLVERMSAEGKFFHHGCFRCEYCGTVLKMMNYAFDQDSGRFFCMPHFGLHSLVKYKYQRKPEQPTDTPDKGSLSVPGAAARGATPERAEFENSVLAVAPEERLSEMDEDEWTDHNFGMSAAELTSEDLLDGEDSEDELSSSDSDEYEPALDEDEVLRLAERWRRRHSQDPLDEPSDLYESDGCDRDGDDSDTATQSETEDDASARLRRQQEVHLAEDVLKSRNRSSKHGDTSDTETSSDSDSSSSEETTSSSEDEDATEVATDSEFDDAPAAAPRPLPTIVIENSAVSEATSPEPGSPRPGERPEPIGAEQGRPEPAAEPAEPAEPPAPAPAPAPAPRTESSEAIAWKNSLELKRKYLTEQTAPYAPSKSQSTTDLDSRVKTFMSRISETQKLLGARPAAAPVVRPSFTPSSSSSGSEQVGAAALPPLEAAPSQDSAGQEQMELEESLTDISVVDSQSGEARAAVLAAFAETMHSSLSEGTDLQTSPPPTPTVKEQPAKAATAEAERVETAPPTGLDSSEQMEGASVVSVVKDPEQAPAGAESANLPVPAAEPTSLDVSPADFDALLGGLDVTRLEEKFEAAPAAATPAAEAPEPTVADDTVSALPPSKAAALDVTRLIEENRTLLSQIRRRRSSGEPGSPARRSAEPEPPPPLPILPPATADSVESPGESAARDATELDLSDWAHESEVASVADVPHEFRVDERFVTVRRGAGEKANLATLSDFEDDVSELPEDPVRAPPPVKQEEEVKDVFDDLDFADNSASGDEGGTAPPPAAKNRGRSPVAATRTPAKSPATPRAARSAAAPPARADIKVSPIVEQASARLLLKRSPTDSAIMLSQRPGAAARPGAPAPRAQQGSLVRDLVLSRVKSPERQLRKRLSSPALGPRVPPPPPPPTAPPPATPPTPRRPSVGDALPSGPPPPKPPRDPAAALSLFTPSTPPARPGALRGALSRSTPSVLERAGAGSAAGTPAGAASPDCSSSPSVSRSPERGGPEGRSDPASCGHDLGKREHPRRRSIIRAISDIFKSGEKRSGAASPPPGSPPERRRSSASPTRAPPQQQQQPAPFVKANSVRDKLGLKFRRGKERRSDGGPESPRTSGEPPFAGPATAHSPDASLSESLSQSQYSDAATPGGSLTRRAKTSRAARHAEMRRLQRAQELQRQLDEVEVRQRDLEQRGIAVERAIRGEGGQASAGVDETTLMHEWFELVHERSLMVRRDQLLQLQLQELQLEDRHDRLQLELRERMATSDAQKSADDVERERQVVSSLLEISEQRRSLRAAMDSEQERLASECESTEGRRAAAASLVSPPGEPAESTV